MNRRVKVISAAMLFVLGGVFSTLGIVVPGANAVNIGDTVYNVARIFVWVGAIIMIASAALFISASTD